MLSSIYAKNKIIIIITLLFYLVSVLSLRDPSTASKLWLNTFTELKALSTDARPEVRNCAIQTLFKTLSTHGYLLEIDTWPLCIAEVQKTHLFSYIPKLTNHFFIIDLISVADGDTSGSRGCYEWQDRYRIRQRRGQISCDVIPSHHPYNNTTHSRSHFNPFRLVHHTRNTNEKQWNETVVFAMQGIIRVFRTFFPIVSSLNGFNDSWAQLLKLFESFAGSKSSEVSKVTHK